MKREGEKVVVSGDEFIKISRLTSDFSNLNQVKNFWLHNITAATAKVLASHFKDNNPQRVIVEDCSAEVCRIIFTPQNFARSSTLDLMNLSPEAASRVAAVLPFSRIGGLVLENLSVEAIERIGAFLLISKIEEVWLSRLTPEAIVKAIDIFSKSNVSEIYVENPNQETRDQIARIRLQGEQTITIQTENEGVIEEETFAVQGQEAAIPAPAEDEQSLIARLTQHNGYLQSVIDRQFALLKEQQQFMITNIPAAAQLPFFQDPDKGSTKRKAAEDNLGPPTSGSQRPFKK